MDKDLPAECFVRLETDGSLARIVRGERGYYSCSGGYTKPELVDRLNEELGVSPVQREAMLMGSMWGWEVPGADPAAWPAAWPTAKVDRRG